MKYSSYLIVGLAVIAFLYFGIFNREQSLPSNWESKIDNQASVTVTITPSDLSVETREWKFDIIMDTHSVELNQDIVEVAVLVDDSGKEYKPLRWEGAPAGGHHREGALIFNQITPTPKFVELKILGIGGVVRSFVWQLK